LEDGKRERGCERKVRKRKRRGRRVGTSRAERTSIFIFYLFFESRLGQNTEGKGENVDEKGKGESFWFRRLGRNNVI